MCDSQYNAEDLRQLGYGPSTVLPIPFFRDEFLTQPGDGDILARYQDGLTNILFVGRLAPNKCQHDVVRAFDYYQKHHNPRSRLILAGLASGSEAYTLHLRHLIDELRTENVIVTGHVAFSQLIAYYQTAHAFLCLSEHEGFCIPLLEAMHFRVPIVAFDGSAVTETLAGSGVMVDSKEPKIVAQALLRVLSDKTFAAKQIEAQLKQLERFSESQFRDRLASMLADALA
ncbi:MAG: glycosyltransferase [Bdellovibrionota bacterium]